MACSTGRLLFVEHWSREARDRRSSMISSSPCACHRTLLRWMVWGIRGVTPAKHDVLTQRFAKQGIVLADADVFFCWRGFHAQGPRAEGRLGTSRIGLLAKVRTGNPDDLALLASGQMKMKPSRSGGSGWPTSGRQEAGWPLCITPLDQHLRRARWSSLWPRWGYLRPTSCSVASRQVECTGARLKPEKHIAPGAEPSLRFSPRKPRALWGPGKTQSARWRGRLCGFQGRPALSLGPSLQEATEGLLKRGIRRWHHDN